MTAEANRQFGSTFATFLAAILAAVLVVVALSKVGWSGPGELEVRLRSARYYQTLAKADVWQADSQARHAHLAARTQALTQIGGIDMAFGDVISLSLVRRCSSGNKIACDRIANDPMQLKALEMADTQGRQRRDRRRQRSLPRAAWSASVPEVRSKGSLGEGLWDTNNGMWDSQQWQSGDVEDTVSNQWLAACTGVFFALRVPTFHQSAHHPVHHPCRLWRLLWQHPL